ncbi:MAG: hypothetical protein V4478_03085 [Patescibacteria group bacterium]
MNVLLISVSPDNFEKYKPLCAYVASKLGKEYTAVFLIVPELGVLVPSGSRVCYSFGGIQSMEKEELVNNLFGTKTEAWLSLRNNEWASIIYNHEKTLEGILVAMMVHSVYDLPDQKKNEEQDAFLDALIETLPVSQRIVNCCKSIKIKSLRPLLSISRSNPPREYKHFYKNLGIKPMRELVDLFAKHGLTLPE